jgi:hypothetical protein
MEAGLQTYLVEHYRPGSQVEELSRLAACLRRTRTDLGLEGKPLRFLRSTIVPADESFLCIVEAASEQLVRDAYARAGIPFERITAAVSDEAMAGSPASTKEEER